jgi:hypothetical protein
MRRKRRAVEKRVRGAGRDTECGVCVASRAVYEGLAVATAGADGSLDQSAVECAAKCDGHACRLAVRARKKASGGGLPTEAGSAVGAPLARLSLVELRPRRARVRFSER